VEQKHPIGDLAARQRYIARSGWLAIPGTVAAAAIAYVTLPVPEGMDTGGARVLLALRWLPVAMLPYVATCLSIMRARFYGGAHDPLEGSESERLRIHCRAMQNTLEQLVWFGVCLLAVAAQIDPPRMKLVPVACVLFAVARFVFWWGYLRSGTLGRAPGVQMTMSINMPLLLTAIALLCWPR
jgi:uncharacterized membrane protein YecN with MAPEG domain